MTWSTISHDYDSSSCTDYNLLLSLNPDQTYYTGNFSCVDGYFMMEREIGYYLIYDKRCSFVSSPINYS